jgi:hypothetical protein
VVGNRCARPGPGVLCVALLQLMLVHTSTLPEQVLFGDRVLCTTFAGGLGRGWSGPFHAAARLCICAQGILPSWYEPAEVAVWHKSCPMRALSLLSLALKQWVRLTDLDHVSFSVAQATSSRARTVRSGRLRSCRQPVTMLRLGGGCSVLLASTALRACSTSAWHFFSSTLRSRRPSPQMRC